MLNQYLSQNIVIPDDVEIEDAIREVSIELNLSSYDCEDTNGKLLGINLIYTISNTYNDILNDLAYLMDDQNPWEYKIVNNTLEFKSQWLLNLNNLKNLTSITSNNSQQIGKSLINMFSNLSPYSSVVETNIELPIYHKTIEYIKKKNISDEEARKLIGWHFNEDKFED